MATEIVELLSRSLPADSTTKASKPTKKQITNKQLELTVEVYCLIIHWKDEQKSLRDYRKNLVPFVLNDKKIVYDLIQLPDYEGVNPANQITEAIGDFCQASQHDQIRYLFGGLNKTVKVSKILQVIDNLSKDGSNTDMNLFITKTVQPLLSRGWLQALTQVVFQTPKTIILRLNLIKYLLANWEWLVGIYSLEVFESVAQDYGSISLKESAIEEDALRRRFIKKVLELELEDLRQTIDQRVEKIITNKERHQFFEE